MIIIPDNLFYLIYIKYTYNKYFIIMKFVKQGNQLCSDVICHSWWDLGQ